MAPRGLLGRSRLKNYFPDSGAGVSDAFVRRKSTGSVYFTRTICPRCSPGFHLGEEAMTRRASSQSDASGDWSFSMLLTEPSFSTTNDSTTRPPIPFSKASAGYFTFFCTHARKLLRSPYGAAGSSVGKRGIVSVTRNASSFSGVPFLIAMAFAAVCSASSLLPLLSDVAGSISAPLSVMTITPLRAFSP